MISLERQGSYRLLETKHLIKVLCLDADAYAWAVIERGGELLTTRRKDQDSDYLLSTGRFNIYETGDEPGMSDGLHLELEVGSGTWQGYLLPIGLPDKHRFRSIITPTNECISGSPRYDQFAPAFGAAASVLPA